MSTDPTPLTPIRPARDWRKLAREAAAAGIERDVAQFIADNTTDRRADGDVKHFAPGYINMIERWLEQEAINGKQ